jgi:hypothetical protein
MRLRRCCLLAGGLAGAVLLAACGGGGGSATNGTPSSGSAAAPAGGGVYCKPGDVAKTDAGFTMVCLAYNLQVFGVSGQSSPQPCGDAGGNCLDPTDPAWPNKGNAGEAKVNNVPFWLADNGHGSKAVKSAIGFGSMSAAAGSVTVPVPPGKYSDLYFIGSAGNGPGTADITFKFSDGTTANTTQQIDDWCVIYLGQTPAGTNAWLPQDRWDNSGNPTTPQNPGCGVLEYKVAIPGGSAKTLTSITFANDPANGSSFNPFLLAITLK